MPLYPDLLYELEKKRGSLDADEALLTKLPAIVADEMNKKFVIATGKLSLAEKRHLAQYETNEPDRASGEAGATRGKIRFFVHIDFSADTTKKLLISIGFEAYISGNHCFVVIDSSDEHVDCGAVRGPDFTLFLQRTAAVIEKKVRALRV